MSEEGRMAFLTAEGLDDWAILHGGPVAAFAVNSLSEAAQLAVAVAEADGLTDRNVALTITSRWLTARLTREMWAVDERHVDVARAISAVARAHGAVADRAAVQEVQFAIAAKPELIDIDFWRAVLGYEALQPDNGLDPLGHSSTVWMQDLDPDKPLRHAMHIDVSLPHEQAEARLAAAVAAGGKVVHDDGPKWRVLSDRSGNKVCIASWPDRAEQPD